MDDKTLESRLNGVDLFGEPLERKKSGKVMEQFYFPPFSVLNARSGEWQERKRAWLSLGIKSEMGRDATTSGSKMICGYTEDGKRKTGLITESDTSIFDPTLTELMYRWFCPEVGQIVDPFAGVSVRGIVASMLNRKYWGCDLRQEQIDANKQQADDILGDTVEVKANDAAKGTKSEPGTRPVWVCGDSIETLEYAPEADFVFSCPPYGSLEKYSDDPADISNMEWHTFKAAYGRIILKALKRLKNNRFACFVVGDFRDSRGYYRDFVSTTIQLFKDCGLELYNEAILVTSVGSASMRVSKQFNSGRKFAKTHQNVLVFCKGDWRKATKACNKEDEKVYRAIGNGGVQEIKVDE